MSHLGTYLKPRETIMNKKGALGILTAIAIASTAIFTVGGVYTVDPTEYIVEKTVNGTVAVKTDPTWYVNYGTQTAYNKLAVLDFTTDDTEASKDRMPYRVKYNDAKGVVHGALTVTFPSNKDQRLALYGDYSSQSAVMDLLVDKALQGALDKTAVLMKSQEAYMTHRALFREYALDQLEYGLYKTYIETIEEVDSEGKITKTDVTRIAYVKDDNGKDTTEPLRASHSPLAQYGIQVQNLDITQMDFDDKTVDQIDLRRDSENAVIISKANADKAAQETKEQQQLALKQKAIDEGKAKAEAAVQVVQANRDKDLAIIVAQRKVSVSSELITQRENELKAARKEAEARTVTSTAEAAARDRLIKSGGELSADQKTTIEVNRAWADAYARKAVPQYNVGDVAQAGSSMDSTQAAMQTLSLKAASQMINSEAK